MQTYKKYILSSILPPMAMLTLILTSLVWITQTLKYIFLIDKGIALATFFRLTILLVPYLLYMILPIITVITIIYVYNHLQDGRQLIIFRNSGLSNYQLAKPALLVAICFTIITWYISMHLMPFSYNLMKQEMANFKEGYISKIIDAKTFNQISKYHTVYVDKKNPDGTLEAVLLFDNKVSANRTMLFAKTGRITISDEQHIEFELNDGFRHSYDHLGNLTKLYFDNLAVIINGETNASHTRKNSELFINEMLFPDASLPLKKRNRLIADGHSRLVWPLFNFAFVFLALSIFLNQPHNRRAHIKPFILTFLPLLLASYLHFTLQKLAYKNLDYIFLCYANVFLCIICAIWQNMKKTL
ncbi:MAG: hypothetical protein COA94_07070 [Rickettsiales bacterium]|nr:MAG: hypothetical protein COA94_07070 [Rickettsiales bacterium]